MKAMMKEIMKNSDQMPPGMLERLAEIRQSTARTLKRSSPGVGSVAASASPAAVSTSAKSKAGGILLTQEPETSSDPVIKRLRTSTAAALIEEDKLHEKAYTMDTDFESMMEQGQKTVRPDLMKVCFAAVRPKTHAKAGGKSSGKGKGKDATPAGNIFGTIIHVEGKEAVLTFMMHASHKPLALGKGLVGKTFYVGPVMVKHADEVARKSFMDEYEFTVYELAVFQEATTYALEPPEPVQTLNLDDVRAAPKDAVISVAEEMVFQADAAVTHTERFGTAELRIVLANDRITIPTVLRGLLANEVRATRGNNMSMTNMKVVVNAGKVTLQSTRSTMVQCHGRHPQATLWLKEGKTAGRTEFIETAPEDMSEDLSQDLEAARASKNISNNRHTQPSR